MDHVGDSRHELRVAVVDDQPLFRTMLVTLLRAQTDLAVVAQAGDVATAKRVIQPGYADVALLDIQLPDGDGLELGMSLRRADPTLGIVLLSSHDVMEVLLGLPESSRHGWSYLSKTSTTSSVSLVRALHASANGRSMLDPELVRRCVPRTGSPVDLLTPRQLEALKFLAQGLSNGAIARELSISSHSVDNLLNSVYATLGLTADPAINPRVSAVLQLISGSTRTAAAA